MRIEKKEITVVKEYFVTSTGEKFENSFDALKAEADFLAKEGRLKTFSTVNEPDTVKIVRSYISLTKKQERFLKIFLTLSELMESFMKKDLVGSFIMMARGIVKQKHLK